MSAQIKLGELQVDVVFKDIKNVHLSVYPPAGRVRVSAPRWMKTDTVRAFVISKLDWIKQEQKKLREQERETPREFLNRESHYLWGQRCLLQVIEQNTAPVIQVEPGRLIMRIRPQTSESQKQETLALFYRNQVRAAAAPLIEKWQPIMGVTVDKLYVRKMKTMWGGCNPAANSIRLNTELAKKPKHCLEYIIVHEMTHLLVPTHNDRFISLMDSFMPHWRHYRDELNAYPLAHEDWQY